MVGWKAGRSKYIYILICRRVGRAEVVPSMSNTYRGYVVQARMDGWMDGWKDFVRLFESCRRCGWIPNLFAGPEI